jgi:hypothetical protein
MCYIEKKKIILDKINELIDNRKTELLKQFPYIHEIDDGIIVRSFTKWDNCDDNKDIKYKKIINENNLDEVIIYVFIPKNTVINEDKKDYIRTLIVLSGKIEININNEKTTLTGFTKTTLNIEKLNAIALEDSYLITSNV